MSFWLYPFEKLSLGLEFPEEERKERSNQVASEIFYISPSPLANPENRKKKCTDHLIAEVAHMIDPEWSNQVGKRRNKTKKYLRK